MAHLPCRHAHTASVAAYPVGARCRLAIRPNGVVLGYGGIQVLRLASDSGRSLVDAVGAAVAPIGSTRGEVTIPMAARAPAFGLRRTRRWFLCPSAACCHGSLSAQ